MILVTTGTNEQPFDRLVKAAADLRCSERLVVQYGSSTVAHGAGEWVDFVGFDELEGLMREARAVVGHAGVGSIMLARGCGHVPIVMARRHHLGEAVDDHQLPLARRLDTAGLVTLVEDSGELAAAVVQDRENGAEPELNEAKPAGVSESRARAAGATWPVRTAPGA